MPDELERLTEDQTWTIYHLRRAGKTFAEIYAELRDVLTYDEMVAAYRSVQKQLATSYTLGEREELLTLELSRLDALQAAAWPLAMAGDDKAIKAALAIVQTRMKLLGMDQITATNSDQITNVLVVSGEGYEEALRHAAKQRTLTSPDRDDDDGAEVP